MELSPSNHALLIRSDADCSSHNPAASIRSNTVFSTSISAPENTFFILYILPPVKHSLKRKRRPVRCPWKLSVGGKLCVKVIVNFAVVALKNVMRDRIIFLVGLPVKLFYLAFHAGLAHITAYQLYE
jgi:hypothetical protein